MVHLQHQLLETKTESDQLNGECRNLAPSNSNMNDRVVALQMNWKW